jgi:ribosomal protein L37AE/L43A
MIIMKATMRHKEPCRHCEGTGYGSAARESGDPRQIGIWQCDYCGGKGYYEQPNFKFSPDELARYKRLLQKYVRGTKGE